ncbi:efflux RND transporter periplasmic adaptor subunit [Pseudoalteromonas maricaloris]|uniref:efflux RND transporter periplasmic adaptor subunit n=1 Tax=Pseudoalteromonas maricaloris TaxID=184924 RepID=UPI003C1C02A1
MDIVKKKSKPRKLIEHKKQLVVAALFFMILAVYFLKQNASVGLQRSEVLIAEVQKGDLDVTIEGYGVLESEKQQLITALTSSTVKEILIKPGSVVTANSVIVELENLNLLQELQNAKQEVELAEANFRQLKLNHQQELLDANARVAEVEAMHEISRLKRAAEESLLKQGIVSKLSYQENLLNEQQYKKQLDILAHRLTQLKQVHREAIMIEEKKISQQKGKLEIVQRNVDMLQVKAGIDGVLIRLPVEIGQNIPAGEVIALIGGVDSLIALLQVPQSQAAQIAIGQKAEIDTRIDKIEGYVARIDPIVENNTVSVEVSLQGLLPASARPNSSVDGVIMVETLENVNYIERPANIKSNMESLLYQLDEDSDSALRKTVKFGRASGRRIEIVSGAEANDRFIISDMSNFIDSIPKVTLKQ